MLTRDQAVEIVESGQVIACIGQLDDGTRRELERLAKRGIIAKWRGYWHPVAGAPWGIGPLKTCYGVAAIRDGFAGWSAAHRCAT